MTRAKAGSLKTQSQRFMQMHKVWFVQSRLVESRPHHISSTCRPAGTFGCSAPHSQVHPPQAIPSPQYPHRDPPPSRSLAPCLSRDCCGCTPRCSRAGSEASSQVTHVAWLVQRSILEGPRRSRPHSLESTRSCRCGTSRHRGSGQGSPAGSSRRRPSRSRTRTQTDLGRSQWRDSSHARHILKVRSRAAHSPARTRGAHTHMCPTCFHRRRGRCTRGSRLRHTERLRPGWRTLGRLAARSRRPASLGRICRELEGHPPPTRSPRSARRRHGRSSCASTPVAHSRSRTSLDDKRTAHLTCTGRELSSCSRRHAGSSLPL